MPRNDLPELFVVDGSNIATEGRSAPSLDQLNEAVLAFLEAHPTVKVTVVVDATFGHRIAKKEVKAFDEAVANNELVTPPAGAVGRGDAFVLAIADRAKAGILSNDSFQEFHGEYEWLFDTGRLIGGKPVPHVGWVFVERTPVRGPKSRQAIREASDEPSPSRSRRGGAKRGGAKKAAADEPTDEPIDEPTEQPAETEAEGSAETSADGAGAADTPAKRSRRGRRGRGKDAPLEPAQQETIEAAKAATPKEYVNELVPFLEFVQRHPVGTSISAVVDSYSSHGAYAKCDDALVYIPLRLMDDPAPRSARSVLALGDAVTAVIVGYVPERRSIDAALPHMAGDGSASSPEVAPEAASTPTTSTDEAAAPPAKRASRKRSTAKKSTAATTKKAPAKASTTKRAAATDPSAAKTTSGARKTSATKKATRTSAAAADTADAPSNAPAQKAAAKKAPAKKSGAEKAPAKKAGAKKAPAKKAPAKKSAAEKAPAKKAPAKKAPAKKAAAKKAAAKKAAASATSESA